MSLFEIFALWRELPEFESWGRPTWARQCLDHPNVYDVGDDDCPLPTSISASVASWISTVSS